MAYLALFDPVRVPQRFQLKPPERIVFDDGAIYEALDEERPTESEVTHIHYGLVEGPNPV